MIKELIQGLIPPFPQLLVVCLVSAAAILVSGILAGDGNFFFESMAREKDFPRRGYFIVAPFYMRMQADVKRYSSIHPFSA